MNKLLSNFGLKNVVNIEKLEGGHTGETFLVETVENKYVLRKLKNQTQAILEEAVFQHLNKASYLPALIKAKNHYYVEYEASWYNLQFFFQSGGSFFSFQEIAETIALLHQQLADFDSSYNQCDRYEILPLWFKNWYNWDFFADLFNLPLSDMHHEIARVAALTNDKSEWIHGDLGKWNILIGNEIKIIDFGEMRKGNIYFDLASSLTSLIGYVSSEATMIAQLKEFISAYFSVRKQPFDQVKLLNYIELWFYRGVLSLSENVYASKQEEAVLLIQYIETLKRYQNILREPIFRICD